LAASINTFGGVLAELALDIAARGGKGEGLLARQDMEQRFLFDGVHMDRTGEAVDQRGVRTAAILANSAHPTFHVGDFAGLRAELTLHPPLLQLFVPGSFTSREIIARSRRAATRRHGRQQSRMK
jgi:hypothetical protein